MLHHFGYHQARTKKVTKKQKQLIIKRAVLAVAIIEPLTTLPQAYEIWVNQSTEGVSTFTWTMYFAGAVIWLSYGLQIKDKPLIISSTLWVITEFSVVLGLVLY